MFTVALIGRVNVGKSTLFNRLIEKRKAIVSKIPGTTRDRNYGQCLWRGEKFSLIDAGGIKQVQVAKYKEKDEIEEQVKKQVELAIQESNLILLILDVKEGLLPQDKEIASLIRKSKKPVILVLNKADGLKERRAGVDTEILKLGMGQPFFVSAVNGSGVGDLLDKVITYYPRPPKLTTGKIVAGELPAIKIAIVGRPNVGKSSLINAILGVERVIVSKIPHTTREPQDTLVSYKGQPILLIDTAGIRKKKRIKSKIEKMGVVRSLEVIRRTDIALLMVEAQEPVARQDKKLASYIIKYHKGAVLAVNKWDLVNQKSIRQLEKKYESYLKKELSGISWAPIIFISAKHGWQTDRVLDLVLKIKKEQFKKIPLNKLSDFLKEVIKKYNLPLKHWGKCRLVQDRGDLPKFILKTGQRRFQHPSPEKFLEKRLREKFGFIGTPIFIKIK
jgi:GTP-binding protein